MSKSKRERKWPKMPKYKTMYGTSVFLCTDLKTLHEAMDYLSEGSSRFYQEKGLGVTVPYTREGKGLIQLIGWFDNNPATLAHECLHASYHLLDNAGIKHSRKNHEVLAYCLSDMMNKFRKVKKG